MRVNVDRVLERDQKLTELDSRAGKYSQQLTRFFNSFLLTAGCSLCSEPPQAGAVTVVLDNSLTSQPTLGQSSCGLVSSRTGRFVEMFDRDFWSQ